MLIGLTIWVMSGFARLKNESFVRQFQDHQRVQVIVGDHTYRMEVVVSSQAQAQGLSGRDSIGSDGLVFLFGQKSRHAFWMKDMTFPIDIVWVDDGRVVEITSAEVAHCYAPDKTVIACSDRQQTLFTPKSEINQVIEVPLGAAAKMGFAVGESVEIQK